MTGSAASSSASQSSVTPDGRSGTSWTIGVWSKTLNGAPSWFSGSRGVPPPNRGRTVVFGLEFSAKTRPRLPASVARLAVGSKLMSGHSG